MTVIDLPFPPSVNRIWVRAKKGMRISDEYKCWQDTVDKFVLFTGAWRRAVKIPGRFSFELALDINERRRAGDLDNRIKAALDWCQRRELIRDDRDCERLTAYWGEAPHGCRITLREVQC